MNQSGYPKDAQTKVGVPTTEAVKSPFADHIPGLTESPQTEEIFEYLDELYERGIITHGFPQALKDKFGISYKDALDYMTEWLAIRWPKEKENVWRTSKRAKCRKATGPPVPSGRG